MTECIGKYEIIEEIGRGGFALVFRARDARMDREVALKVIAGSFAEEPSFIQRFQQEVRTAANLRHPNIVPVYDFGEEDGVLYLAMALVDQGRTLRDLLVEQAPLCLEHALPILTPLAAALDYLRQHDPSLTHRDVKPANVLLEGEGSTRWVMLTDFGLVRSMEAGSMLTQSGSILGTPAYMAPELVDPKQWGEVTPLTDVYALGVIAYEALTGRAPFAGEVATVLHAHAYEAPPSPQDLLPALGDDLSAVLLRALAKPPEERYPSAGAFVTALREVADARTAAQAREVTLEQLEAQTKELLEAGEWLEALDCCTQMVRLDPDWPAALEMLTRAKQGLDREQAEMVKRRGLAVRYQAGLALLTEGKWKQALDAFETIAEGDAEFRDVQEKLAQARDELQRARWYDEAIAHGETGRWDEACRLWIDLLRGCPNYQDGEALPQFLIAADALLDYQRAARSSSEQQSRNVKRVRDALTLYDDLAAAMDAKDWENAVQLGKSLSRLMFSESGSDLDHLRVWLTRAQSELQRQATPWIVHLDRTPIGQPLVVGKSLLVPMQDSDSSLQRSVLYALSVADGSIRWQKVFEYALISGLAVNADGLILVSSSSTDLMRGEGALLALDEAGTRRWRWSPGVQRVSAPTLAENKVWITADTATLVVIDPDTVTELVRTELEARPSSSAPAVDETTAYVPCRGPHLLAVGSDGRSRWKFDATGYPYAWLDETSLIIEDLLFSVLSTGTVLSCRMADGSLVWFADVGPVDKPLSPLASDGERLFVGARDGLHALALADGREVWTAPTERRIEAAPIVVGGVVYTTCHDHRLYALDAVTGRELWQYQVDGRIEVSPCVTACGESSTPCVIIADRSGTLTAVVRPLSAAEHAVAGNWREAVSVYTTLGQFAQGAELLEAQGELLEAAELWMEAGKRERGAELCEASGAWQRAAELWFSLERQFRQATALEGYARSLEDTECSLKERVTAWEVAAEAFDAEGEVERAAICRKEIARCLQQPIITLNIQHDGLVLNAWSRLQLTVHNEGYGPAHNIVIRAAGDQFEGQVMTTLRIARLNIRRKHVKPLDIRPLQCGKTVPLRLTIEYTDKTGEACICEQRVYVDVAELESDRGAGQVFNISTAGGTAIIGDVEIERGSFVGRDASANAEST